MRTTLLTSAFVLASAIGANADSVAFIGPAGWSHSPPSAQSDPARTVDQWHISGDIATVTYTRDTATSYADALAAIEKNISTNGLKTSANKDMPCHGGTGHVVEFAFGPDGNRVITNRLLVPDGAGLDSITYSRSDGSAFDADVKKAEAAFCGTAP